MPFLDKITGGLGAARVQQTIASRDAAKYGRDVYRPGNVAVVDEAARVCGALDCSSWQMPWKNRRRPIFEDEWGCSGKCLASMVRTAVRREVTENAGGEDNTPHRHRVPLGLVLLAQGWITHPELQTALEAQRSTGEGRVGDWLVQGGLEEERITRGLGVQWGCPVLSMEGFTPNSMALVMPKRFITEFGMLPLRTAGSNIIYLGFEDRLDASGALAVEQMTSLKVESGLLSRGEYVEARAGLLEADSVATTIDVVPNADALVAKIVKLIELAQPISSRLVRMHQYYWLRIWLESGALSGAGTLPSGIEDVHDYVFSIGSR